MTDKRLEVLSANIENMKRPPLGEALRTMQPEVVVLQQASVAGSHLETFGRYDVRGSRMNYEAKAIKVLVRDDVSVLRQRWLHTLLAWTGPKTGRRHLGRTFLAVYLLTPFRCWVVDVHFPTGGPHGPNAEAWWEAWREIVKFARRRKRVAFVGDFNATAEELKRLAEEAGFYLATIGKVDHALSKGLRHIRTVRNLPDTPETVHGWGSVVYELKEK